VTKLINIIIKLKIFKNTLENHKGMSDASNDTPVMVEVGFRSVGCNL
jgi:hypothetical protein